MQLPFTDLGTLEEEQVRGEKSSVLALCILSCPIDTQVEILERQLDI